MLSSLVLLTLELHAVMAFKPQVSVFEPRFATREWYVLNTNEQDANHYSVIFNMDYYGHYISHDFGINWSQSNTRIGSLSFAPGKLHNDDLFHITFDGGQTFQNVPLPPGYSLYGSDGRYTAIIGHPTQNDWLIFNTKSCDSKWKHCKQHSYVTTDRGANWKSIKSGGDAEPYCYFVTAGEYVVYCQGYDDWLDYTPDFRSDTPTTAFGPNSKFSVDINDNFVVRNLYSYHKHETLHQQPAVSNDGFNFRRAQLPPRFSAYDKWLKPLDGSNKYFLFATYDNSLLRSGKEANEFTAILNFAGNHLDFDKIPSMEGVYIVTLSDKSMISHDAGTTWTPVIGPNSRELKLELDSGKSSTLVHAPGMYIAVGSESGNEDIHHTYMTRDGGVTWYVIAERAMLWAVAEQGSVIVMVIDAGSWRGKAESLSYSLDQGASWEEYNWGDKLHVKGLVGSPDGEGSQVILDVWEELLYTPGYVENREPHHLHTLNFATDDVPRCESSDFETWVPEYPELKGSKCVLGKKTVYTRRLADHMCLIGSYFKDRKRSEVTENCECSREDYECDYTHELDSSTNECKPVEGAYMPTQEEQCINGAISWKKFTGYRKIAASSCHGDPIEDSTRHACPGKEKEFSEGVFDIDRTLLFPEPMSKKAVIIMWVGISLVILTFVVTILVLIIIYRHNIKGAFKLRSSYKPVDSGSTGSTQSSDPSFWQRFKARLPFFGSRISNDSLGLYRHMDNEERNRLVEEDYEIGDLEDSPDDAHSDHVSDAS